MVLGGRRVEIHDYIAFLLENSNPSGYPPTGMMFEVTRKVKCYVGLAFRICGTINLWRTDGRAGGQDRLARRNAVD